MTTAFSFPQAGGFLWPIFSLCKKQQTCHSRHNISTNVELRNVRTRNFLRDNLHLLKLYREKLRRGDQVTWFVNKKTGLMSESRVFSVKATGMSPRASDSLE